MKGIRMAVLGAALVFGMTTAAEAQERGGRGGRGGVGRLMTDITVSADVQTKIDEIVQKYMTQQREMMTAAGVEPGAMQQMSDEMRAKMTELTTKRNAEVRALLTAEQQVVFDKNVATAAQGRRGGGGGGGATPPPPPPAL
jgi:Spy/CpxP family protein refolding chaperone